MRSPNAQHTIRVAVILLSSLTVTAHAAWWPTFGGSAGHYERDSSPVSTRDEPYFADLAKAFPDLKRGAWTAEDHFKHREVVRSIADEVDKKPAQTLTPELEELKTLIETTPRFYLHFTQMFDQIPWRTPYHKNLIGEPQIRDYEHLLQALNLIVTNPPTLRSLGIPIYAILAYPLGTTSGYAAFLDPQVNDILRRMLNRWGSYLKTNESAHVLTTEDGGWLQPNSLEVFAYVADAPFNTTRDFEELYECDPGSEHYGFTSWDDFFTRRFRPGIRPIASPNDDDIIVSACEAKPLKASTGVKLRDKFWAKGQPYSLTDMLHNETLATSFVNGTVYQAFLSASSYHRWQSPISGTVKYAYNIEGTYFSTPLFESLDTTNVSSVNAVEKTTVDDARGYLSAMATRSVIIMEADNPKLGLVAFVAIGMEEISSCEITVKVGQHIKKGDDTGTFHYGGSSYTLIFQEGVELVDFPTPSGDALAPNLPVGAKLARVKSSTRG